MTPKLMKAWQMRKSVGARRRSGPIRSRWKWLHYKGRIDDKAEGAKRLGPYLGHYEALKKYNAAPTAPGIPKSADYANAVLNYAWASYGDWQQ